LFSIDAWMSFGMSPGPKDSITVEILAFTVCGVVEVNFGP